MPVDLFSSPWCSVCPVTVGVTILLSPLGNQVSTSYAIKKKYVGSPSADLLALGIEDASLLEESFPGGPIPVKGPSFPPSC